MLVLWQHLVVLRQCHVLRHHVVTAVATTVATMAVIAAARKNAVGGNFGKTNAVVQNATNVVIAVIRY